MILKNIVCVCLLASALPSSARDAAPQAPRSAGACDPALTTRFAPRHPQMGRYDVCADPDEIDKVAPDSWTIEPENPLDAFGSAPVDRARLMRLYGGMQPRVARGWRRASNLFESVTLISPYPALDFTRLEPGTLVIRWISPGQNDPR